MSELGLLRRFFHRYVREKLLGSGQDRCFPRVVICRNLALEGQALEQ
jgi:hypothetical protein